MWRFYYLLPFFIFSLDITACLQKTPLKTCASCKHYIEILYKESIAIGNYYGKCSKFMDIHHFTGEIDFSSAIMIRNDETKCGRNATLFEK